MTRAPANHCCPALEAQQRANGCNHDNEPGDWGVPCCDLCMCKQQIAAAQLLRAAGWTCKPPPDPNAPCSHCGKPADYHGPCKWGGCPIGADL